MKEEYVSYSQAQALKRLGFEGNGLRNHIAQGYYIFFDGRVSPIKHDGDGILPQFRKENAKRIPAPRIDQAQKWLREVKKIVVYVVCQNHPNAYLNDMDACYFSNIVTISGSKIKSKYWNSNLYQEEPKWFESYEQALSAGIDAALKLLEEQQ